MNKYHVTMFGNGGVLASQFIKAECLDDAFELAGYYVFDYLGYTPDVIEEIRISGGK